MEHKEQDEVTALELIYLIW